MQLSICIIAKNEEKNIKRCLQALAGYDFEIVVVDTGSTDATKEIAYLYTNNVYDFTWCDDFAAAKNFAISKAGGEFVMVLDCDEYLEYFDAEKLEELLRLHPEKVGRILRKNKLGETEGEEEVREYINRIFSKKLFYYEGRIHEQVVSCAGESYEMYEAPVSVIHSGYILNKEERKNKTERNISMLLRELELITAEKKVEQIPYILYQLGKSYYMARDYEEACSFFARGLSYDLNPKLEYVIDMVETYGYALINSGQAEMALFFENIYKEFGQTADFQFLMGLIYMNNARFEDAVNEFLKATTHKECRNVGVNSFSAFYNIGVIYECLEQWERAKEYYEKCGDYEPAKKRLNDETNHHLF